MRRKISIIVMIALVAMLAGCSMPGSSKKEAKKDSGKTTTEAKAEKTEKTTTATTEATTEALPSEEEIEWNDKWEYAEYSKIHSDSATLYRTDSDDPKDQTVCVNAGHGTKGGESVSTQCHPDGSAKVTGGSTSKGSKTATAINSGTTLDSGITEAEQNLKVALNLKDKLLEAGYNVLMVRESDDSQLDNIARTVMANNNADYHISIHYDSTESDKGAFYIGAADDDSYRSMEPVASHWKEHKELGESIIAGMKDSGVMIWNDGCMNMDLTQISYSTIPSVDLEVGDKAADLSDEELDRIADGIVEGLNNLQK